MGGEPGPPPGAPRPSEALGNRRSTISLRRKVKTGRLRSCRRAADWLVPCIHLTLLPSLLPPGSPSPASTRPAASSWGSGERVGGPDWAAKAMEASAGDDQDPGDLRAHRPAAPAAPRSAKCRGGGGGAEPRSGPAAGSRRPQPSVRGGPAVGGGLGCPGVPRPRSAAPCVSLPRRRRSLIRARRLQRRLQRRCAKPGRSGAGGGTAEGEWTQVRRPRPAGGTALRRPGRGPLATARCDRIPPRAPREGLSVTHSCPPFSPLHLP